MRGEGFDDIEFDARVAGEAVEGEVGVSLGVVLGGVVYDAGWGLARCVCMYVCMHVAEEDVQGLAPTVALSRDKVPSSSQDPVQCEASSLETLVRVVCGLLAVAPVLDVKLLAVGDREEGRGRGENVFERNHLGSASGNSRGAGAPDVAFNSLL